MCQISLPTPARLRLRIAGRRAPEAGAPDADGTRAPDADGARAPDADANRLPDADAVRAPDANRLPDAARVAAASASAAGRGPTLRTTGASDLSKALGGVLLGYSQRSAMMHFGHAGTRATHT
jgi:hypothetical protein